MKIIYMLLFLPAFVFAQTGKKSNAGLKIKPQVTTGKKPLDGFVIEGTVKGFPDGTKVDLLNGQTGVSETSTTIQKDKFTIKGKMTTPDFRIIIFNNQPPFITLFMDNSAMKITGTKEKIETAQVTGSKTQADYEIFNKAMESFKAVFDENAPYDSVTSYKAMQVTCDFARQHHNSLLNIS